MSQCSKVKRFRALCGWRRSLWGLSTAQQQRTGCERARKRGPTEQPHEGVASHSPELGKSENRSGGNQRSQVMSEMVPPREASAALAEDAQTYDAQR